MIAIVVLGLLSVTTWKAGMNIPILGGIVAAAVVGAVHGHRWKDLQQSLVHGVSRALPAVFILIIVGSIVGTWILGGIIPTMIYYSLEFISPMIFIPACTLVTALIATATGTSFTSIATVGLALMATGIGIGFPAPVLAGAIICGAYFGDSMSPLSDTTNLASAMSGCTLFELVGHMLWTGIPGLLVSCAAFFFMGLPYGGAVDVPSATIVQMLEGLHSNFTISPWLLIIPVITILLSICKTPALPALLSVSLLGGIAALAAQHASVSGVINAMTSGYKSNTGMAMLDNLLSRGGINSMSNTVVLLSMATALGGILEQIGVLDSLLKVVMKRVKRTGGLILVTVFSSLFVAFATGAQLLAIMLPARMFEPEYRARGLHTKNLGRVAQSIGAVAINLVPWSVPSIYAANILGVEATAFIPYVFFAYALILLNILYGYTGFTLTKERPKENVPAEKIH
ncbi:MAG: Na+/H+ antiporter NhaC [Synergistaceae bacterium]|nr:Na+/H+ antiporter NhaC [Synergistaceae bacterium]